MPVKTFPDAASAFPVTRQKLLDGAGVGKIALSLAGHKKFGADFIGLFQY